jgi:hypothetical protein
MKYEYKIIHLNLSDAQHILSQVDDNARNKFDELIEKELNQYAKEGWRVVPLPMPDWGLILERPVNERATKNKSN